MGRSSVAGTAADFLFVSGIHKLVERWDKCFDKLEGYVENESKMPKEFTFEVLNR